MTIGVWTVREAGLWCRWYVSLTPARAVTVLRRGTAAGAGRGRAQPGSVRPANRLLGRPVGKVETGERAPPGLRGGLRPVLPHGRTVRADLPAGPALGRRLPLWFAEWIDSERRATSVCWWEPLLIPGLLQTADYARAILTEIRRRPKSSWRDWSSLGWNGRRSSTESAPPTLWAVLDEAVLHRLIGSRKIMYEQLLHLADILCRSNITVQIVPAEIGAHAGLLGGFAIASFDNARGTVYMESPDHGQTTELPSVVGRLSLTFDTLRADALPRGASRDLIGKVAEQRWATP